MNRLTKKAQFVRDLITGKEIKYISNESNQMCVDKLGALEDIEEELGIDLITLFKALKNDFYFKYKDKIISSNDYLFQIRANIRGNWIFDIISDNLSLLSIKFKDYGKTWALTKEELEDE